jgi:Cu(I)/Ag(I) efflux system membrane fusion protein/cobalt-zinc-cadmium efflux system membrane fusion protein
MPRVNRGRLWIGIFVFLVALAAAAGYIVRRRQSVASTAGPRSAPRSDAAASPRSTPRVEVTIDPRRQQLIGVRTVPVERRPLSKTVRTVGLVRYDETRLADVNLKLEGWIRDLYVDFTGQFVRRGQPLFTIYSPELVTTQNEYLLALKTREHVRQSQIADAREHAERLVESARQRLALWDLPDDQLKALEETRQPQTAVVFRSPASGFVIEKQALKGMHVMPGQSLYKVADLSAVWVEADVYEQDMRLVRRGAQANVTLDAYPDERFSGRVIYVYPFVAEKTRTVKVRFEFPNRGSRLKPGMYANVELSGPSTAGLVIPLNALLDSGKEQIVFVAQGDGYFEPRRVKVGRRLDDRVEILAGLKEGEAVATGAAFFLDSESQLRASLQAYETPPAAEAGTMTARERLDISFRSQPDPPRSGENQFEVSLKTADGKAVTDAQVTVAFFMAAMPSMNMPAMRNDAKLTHAGGGVYRGTGQVLMAGRWDVTVTVTRGGQRLGAKQLSIVAR